MVHALVNPEIIKWARNRSNISSQTLARKLQVAEEKVSAWENGEALPTYRQAKRTANVLQVPFGYLYLTSPPREEVPLPDLRSVGTPGSFSTDFLNMLSSVLRKQQWYKSLLEYEGSPGPGFVGRFKLGDDVMSVADSIRDTLSAGSNLSRLVRTWNEYLSELVRYAEQAGILVFRNGVVGNNTHRRLSVAEFRGFALIDKLAPAVFINARDSKAAQIFTLAHEIAHLWIGESGVSNVETETPTRDLSNDIEIYCNKVATQFLVPKDDFEKDWNPAEDLDGQISRLARTYRVSTTMILRRALELEKIGTEVFFEQLSVEKQRQDFKPSTSTGGDFRNNLMARNGHLLVSAIFEAVMEGRVLYREAATILDLKVGSLTRLASEFGAL